MNTKFTSLLWNSLWQDYIARVGYARVYQEMIVAAGGTVANDHIAFRSLRMTADTPQGKVNLGIGYLEPVVKFLGYEVAGEYFFPETHLYARHYRHPQQDEWDLPKLFISELIVDELPNRISELIGETVKNGDFVSPSLFELNINNDDLLGEISRVFTRPWFPPRRSLVEEVNKVTQYGAWVLLHGYAVNHFTGYVNRHNTPKYPDIESTVRGLTELGVPMKAKIEGSYLVGLRQTATHAVKETVSVIDDISRELIQIPWTYAYYEIAQRYLLEAEPGKQVLFDAFLGKNAQLLFEMTRLSN